jgi:hypothetical protein
MKILIHIITHKTRPVFKISRIESYEYVKKYVSGIFTEVSSPTFFNVHQMEFLPNGILIERKSSSPP